MFIAEKRKNKPITVLINLCFLIILKILLVLFFFFYSNFLTFVLNPPNFNNFSFAYSIQIPPHRFLYY